MSAPLLLAHPFGNANVRQAALALHEARLLYGFRTCIDWNPHALAARLMPMGLRQMLERRSFPTELTGKIRAHSFREMGRLLASRMGWTGLTVHETGWCSVDAVTIDFDRWVAAEIHRRHAVLGGVYAYEDGAGQSFAAARRYGLACHYDLPIGYWRVGQNILQEEAERQPEWASTLSAMADSPEKLARKDEELALADTVIVASRFTASTLSAAPSCPAQVHIIPYGAPPPQTTVAPPVSGPLRVLFAGSLGQRKGTSYLLEAVEILGKSVSLTLLGSRPAGACAPLDAALRHHRWIPSLAHAGVLEEMRRHDVLVFPSLFEGFGLVMLEALSQGIPVIATAHTGGPDILTDGADGFIVPVRDAGAIVEKLALLHRDRPLLEAMKAAALAKAGLLCWENYRRALVDVLTLD